MLNNKDLEKAGIINSILVLAVVVINLANIKRDILDLCSTMLCLVALMFGLLYVFSGYKKESAKNYKLFFISFVLYCVINCVFDYISTVNGDRIFISTIIEAITALFGGILAFKKDLHKNKSYALAITMFVLELINLVRALIVSSNTAFVINVLNVFTLTCLASMFVVAKYVDKQARGAQ